MSQEVGKEREVGVNRNGEFMTDLRSLEPFAVMKKFCQHDLSREDGVRSRYILRIDEPPNHS